MVYAALDITSVASVTTITTETIMRTLKITVTDENGILVDQITIDVKDTTRKIACVELAAGRDCISSTGDDLIIGAPRTTDTA